MLKLYEEGKFCPSHPTDDILTQALEKPEHLGRVRGVGAYVTPTQYFSLNKETNLRMGNIVQEIRAEFRKQITEMSAQILELRQHIMKNDVEDKDSCSNKNVSGDDDDKEILHDVTPVAKVPKKMVCMTVIL